MCACRASANGRIIATARDILSNSDQIVLWLLFKNKTYSYRVRIRATTVRVSAGDSVAAVNFDPNGLGEALRERIIK